MNLKEWAENELDLIGLDESDEYNGMMRKHILHMVDEFAKEGHSGMSANYAINALNKLLRWEPISPLTGEDWEWQEVGLDGDNGGMLYQNVRCPRVFKNDNGAWDNSGIVFWEWNERPLEPDEDGYPGVRMYKSHYTSRDSRTPVTFPYTPQTEYVERKYES